MKGSSFKKCGGWRVPNWHGTLPLAVNAEIYLPLIVTRREFQPDRGFAAEHGNGYVYLVLIRLNRRYNADKACQRAVDNANTVACGVVYLDLALFHAHCDDLFLSQRNRLRAAGLVLTQKAGAAARIADQIPGFIGHDHLNEHVARVQLALYLAAFAVLYLNDLLGRDVDGLDQVMQLAVFDRFFDRRGYLVFVAGVRMNNVPFCSV